MKRLKGSGYKGVFSSANWGAFQSRLCRKVDIQTEVFVLKGRVMLKKNRFLQIYFNELTGTNAFTFIEEDQRVWGIDFDNLRGWHLHPLNNPEDHRSICKRSIEEIIKDLAEVWSALK